jgi:hypothetical protein
MLDLKKIEIQFAKEGNKFIRELQTMMIQTGANASGRTSASLLSTTSRTNTSVNLMVDGGIGWAFVEQGRGATRNKNGKGILRGIIRQWIDDKGITPDEGMTKDTLAFLITRAIHQRGTLLHFLGERREIYTTVLTESAITQLLDNTGSIMEKEVSTDLVLQFA